MAIVFSHEVGFYGVVKLSKDKATDPDTAMLATGGDISVIHDPMFTSGVWGAGWYTAANQVAYAVNSLHIEGSVNFELAYGDILTAIKNFAFENRGESLGHQIQVWPQGAGGYKGPAWCNGVSFDASEGALVTGTFNYQSGDMSSSYWTTTAQPGVKGPVGQAGAPPSPPTSVYPYWGTSVWFDLIQLPDVTTWGSSYDSTIMFVTLCKDRTEAPIEADYIMVGGMNASGNFTIFKLSDQLLPVNFHTTKSCTIKLHPGHDMTITNQIEFSNIIFNNGSTAVQTGDSYITSDISFTAIGDGTKPPMLLS